MSNPVNHPADRAREDLPDATGDAGDPSMLRREEELHVGTERVISGRVVVRKRIVEEEQTLTVTVRREELEIVEEASEAAAPGLAGGERAADREAAAPEGAAGRENRVTAEGRENPAGRVDIAEPDLDGDGAEIILYGERPVVTFERVPVERVRVRRSVSTTTEQVTADIAREVVEVVEEGGEVGEEDADSREGRTPRH